uniref:Uncharacterized protein n=1 Tax=Chromera velia CCMP2878 TaxID=1169474 RepID=A0A0G4HI13_9ALVE|eukprot:Cvel_6896.t1-p1 / transcript=Cvel_6896.t1 / gene=Cvel_6896 / organism=Chromera_velia_CCMP2878 / gene_product=hypothetical protein / transcript_product=hypothetical protein / location=Cvel_scaffold348:91558-95519(+) / protein_length=406 / sequence_SO=supercontig / SO=protein_coding / is_pseudo=false
MNAFLQEIYQKDPISALCSRVADEYDVLHKIDRLEQAVENWARNDDNWRLFASIHKHFANMKRHLETLLRKVPKVNGGKIGGKLALPSGSSIRTQQKKVQTKKKLQNRKEKDPKNKKEESQHPSGLLQTEAEAQGRPAFSPEELRTNEPLKILCVETTGDADDETTRSLCTKPPLLPSLKAEQQKQVDRALPFQGGLGRLLMSVAFICLSADVRRLAPSQTQLRLVQTTALPSTLQRPHRDAAFLQAPSTAKAKDKDRDLSQISLLDLDPHASLYSAFPKTTQTAPATDANRGGLHPIREALLSAFCPDDLESQDASEICANRMQGDLSAFLDEHWQHAPFTALHGGLPVPEPHKEEAEKTLSPSLARPGGYGETTKEQEGTATFGNTVPALPSLKSSAPFEKIRL